MKVILIPLFVILAVMVVISLVRGIIAFLHGSKADLAESGSGPTASQLRQNQMMFARIKYQALAVIVLMILLAASR